MAQPSAVQKLQQTETEVAVLQAQYGFLNEKVDDIKTSLRDLSTHIDEQTESTQNLIKSFQEENKKQHDTVNEKIASFEKWRWMLMGAGVLAGALGWPTLSSLLGI
jgi:phage shock protein A